jgi:hypothetical protein
MKFNFLTYLLFFPLFFALTGVETDENKDYLQYHKQINEAERLISMENFKEALYKYENVFDSYDFVFLRDYKIAAQIAFYLKEKRKSFNFIKKGIADGWDLKALKKNKFLTPLQDEPGWVFLENNYISLRSKYLARINQQSRKEVGKMFKNDQKKAFGALFKIGDKAQEKYAIKKFAPHSEIQMARLIKFLENQGYPGEKIIGNNFWMSTIISHHNSISEEYNSNDTIYLFIKPALIQAIKKGQISPYEYALVDDWKKAVVSKRTETGYGFLTSPYQLTLSETNCLRQNIGLRTIELRNKLVDIEERTGMNFYLPDWIKGKIRVEKK